MDLSNYTEIIKLGFVVVGSILFFFNIGLMYKPLTVDHPSVAGNKNREKNVRETLAAHEIWNEIGKFYQFISVPFQWLILSATMASLYFSFGPSYMPYLSILVLVCIFIFGLLSKKKIENALDGKHEGAAMVRKMHYLGIRSSLSFAVIIFLFCVGI